MSRTTCHVKAITTSLLACSITMHLYASIHTCLHLNNDHLHVYKCMQEYGPTDVENSDKLSLVINAHTRAISCIAVNYDGTKVATASTKVCMLYYVFNCVLILYIYIIYVCASYLYTV